MTKKQASNSPCYEADDHDYNEQENTNTHADGHQPAFWRTRRVDGWGRRKEGCHYWPVNKSTTGLTVTGLPKSTNVKIRPFNSYTEILFFCVCTNIPLGRFKVTASVWDPCLFLATQQCSPYSSAETALRVRPLPAGTALDLLAEWALVSADGRHAAPLYQAYVCTGGLASLLQVRVTGSPSPAGETEMAVFRGESRCRQSNTSEIQRLVSHTSSVLLFWPTLHVDGQNCGVLRLVFALNLTDVASGVGRSDLADVPHLSTVSGTDTCGLEPSVTDLWTSCQAAAGQA